MKKKILIPIIAGASAIALTAAALVTGNIIKTKNGGKPDYDFSASTLNIDRKEREKNVPMGEEGTWTVFVYMCGSDLESKNGSATSDWNEMLASSANEKVRFIVQTGGAVKWRNGASSTELQRYDIHNGKAELADHTEYKSMGNSETLTDFLDWGIENYPAANMGVVLWDHGGGCINGVCFDEKENMKDSLLLRELDAALYSVYDKMTEPFEFIGFDACLMSTVENAALMSSHAKYMIASAEAEPGEGWDYKAIGDYLSENPKADGDALGKIVCDSYYASCEKNGGEKIATLSVTDLSKIDTFLNGFDIFAKDIYELSSDTEFLSFWRNVVRNSKYYSSQSTNLADLKDVIESGSEYSETASDLVQLLDDMVIYSVNGKFHSESGGLSVYFPYDVFNAADQTVLSIYEDLSVSPYYLGSMAKICCSCLSAMQDMLSNFDLSSALSSSLSSWGTNSYSGSGSHYSYNYSESSIWSFVNDIQETGSSNVIDFENKPALDADGHYSFTLTQSSMDYTNDVYSNVYMWLDDKKQLFELGDSGNINADYENRKFTDNFDGNWFSLPDGQLLCADFITSSEEGELYSSPILYNGNESNLRFMYDKKSNTAYMIDICESISENGASARSEKLEKGDAIVPRYRIQDKNSEETIVSQGKEFTYTGDSALKFSKLPKGEYWYAFRIDDLFGDHLMTEPVKFVIENENSAVTFQTEEHKWIAATCTTPEYCAFCGETKGVAAGHKWKKADCDNPETCSVCGETKGKALGHDWEEATFTAPKTCKRCGKTEGEKLKYEFPQTATVTALDMPIYTFTKDLVSTHNYDIDNDNKDEIIGYYESFFIVFDDGNEYRIPILPGADHATVPAIIQNGNDGRIYLAYIDSGGPATMIISDVYDAYYQAVNSPDELYMSDENSQIIKAIVYYNNDLRKFDLSNTEYKIKNNSVSLEEYCNYESNLEILVGDVSDYSLKCISKAIENIGY